ncbi:MAG TPA: sulfatase-like hydrolase/transferase [Isosphaeraceae bacterium]|jgi:arylsulfatase A-like enzyme|nr:sulfatase-like hydrolase/transferase [Isosphaeraceae bacterium]
MRAIGATMVLGTVLAGSSPAVGAAERPNLVLILADDLGWGDVGFNGRKSWATPNLDRFAAQGTTFRRFYTAGAVCNPSRAAILTGKSTIHCGVTGNGDDLPSREVTVAEALKAQGYATGLFGKWHQGRPRAGAKESVHPMDQGFDEFFGDVDARDAWEKFPKRLWDGRTQRPVAGYADDLFTDRAIDFLKRRRQRPFFLYIPYINSHFNIAAPEDEIARFRGKFAEVDPKHPANATYAAMVARLDRNVGRVLAALDEQGLAGNTLVVFTSDQGATFESGNKGTSVYHDSNAPFRGQKRTLWEGGMRVPAAARWPGHIPGGTVSDAVMQTIDLFPTFLAAAGVRPESAWHLDGNDLLPAWTRGAPSPDRTLFFEWRSEGSDLVAALRGDFKLVVQRGGKPELYDVVADPAERRDVSALHPDLVRGLHSDLKAWLATESRAD